MQDTESIINRDKSEAWVCLWHKQYWEEKDGKKIAPITSTILK
jgi:hypothetical protein